MAQPVSRVDIGASHTNGGSAHLQETVSPTQIKRIDELIGDDENEAFPRKKRRKLAVDERKRAVRA
jgi:hypothetical protein